MSRFKQFIPFHTHQNSLDSGSTPEAFAKRFAELGSPYDTTTDHGTLQGAIKVYDTAKKNGLKPILGIEGYLRGDDCPILKGFGIEKDEKGTTKNYLKYSHITLHAQDQVAYQNLGRVLSRTNRLRSERHGSELKGIFSWDDLEELGQYNITCGSGCLIGFCQRHLFNNRPDIAEQYYLKAKSLFKPGNFLVEVFPHVCSHKFEQCIKIVYQDQTVDKFRYDKKLKTDGADEITAQDLAKAFNKGKHKNLLAVKNYSSWDESRDKAFLSIEKIEGFVQNDCTATSPDGDLQKPANKFMLGLAEKYGDPVIVSGDEHIAYPEDKIVQDVRLSNGVTGQSWKFHTSYHIFSSDEAFGYFRDYLDVSEKTFEKWVDNSYQWASGFDNFKLEYKPSLPASSYPKDSLKYLNQLLSKHGRMKWDNEVYKKRLKDEIELFHNNGHMDWLPYFFACESVSSWMEQHEVLGSPSRGSAGGVLLAYLLGITHTEPIRYGLSKERFMTLDRILNGKYPDIDLDFGDRSTLFDLDNGFLETNFHGRYAQVSNDTLLRLKSSILDVNRAMNKDRGFHGVSAEISTLTKKMPLPPQGINDKDIVFGYVGSDGNYIKGWIDTEPNLKQYVRSYPDEWKIVQKLLGITRQKSVHACLPAGELILTLSETDQTSLIESEIEKCHNSTVLTGMKGNLAKVELIPQGIKTVKKYLLSNQKTIICTEDHRVMTSEGWMTIGEAFHKKISILLADVLTKP